MGSRLLFTLLTVCLAAIAIMTAALPPESRYWLFLPAGTAIVVLLLLWRSVVRPSVVAMRGMELISSQDLNNRLTTVGEHNADKVVRLFNSLIDRLREERLRNIEQEGFLSLLIEASPMGVMILDFNGRVSLINDSMLRITGIPDGRGIPGLMLEELPTDMAARMAAVPLGENKIITCGNARRYRCYHLSFVQTGFRRRFYLLESLTEEMMKAEREAYEKVIRIISHEVNNTMGGVKSVLGMISDTTDDSEVREVIESCDDRCEMMCSFIRAYADVVKLPDPVRRPVDLAGKLADMLPFLRGLAGSDITLRLSAAPGLTAIVDIALVQQVVVNIVKNAAESITGSGHIDITAGKTAGNVWLEIANDGEPISEEVSRQLFSPFFTTKREGRGLGLTLISEILNRHNATFSLLTGPDGITRFHITFP